MYIHNIQYTDFVHERISSPKRPFDDVCSVILHNIVLFGKYILLYKFYFYSFFFFFTLQYCWVLQSNRVDTRKNIKFDKAIFSPGSRKITIICTTVYARINRGTLVTTFDGYYKMTI